MEEELRAYKRIQILLYMERLAVIADQAALAREESQEVPSPYIQALLRVKAVYRHLGGGVGGGGYIQIVNADRDNFDAFDFSGPIVSYGSFAGIVQNSQIDGINRVFSMTDIQKKEENIKPNEYLPACGGQAGYVDLSVCPASSGSNSIMSTIYAPYETGYYTTGQNSDLVLNVIMLPPTHSTDVSSWTSSDCPYICDAEYPTDLCYNQFQKFFASTLGVGGMAGIDLGILLYY